MLKQWQKYLTTDCKVIRIDDDCIYPIYRNASSGLFAKSDSLIINHEIKGCESIKVFIQEPLQRFTSGLNQYCMFNSLDVDDTWKRVDRGEIMDRHFVPQWSWLCHLYNFYKGNVTLEPMANVSRYLPEYAHRTKYEQKQIPVINELVEIDLKLMEYIGQQAPLGVLIKECRDVLS